MVKDIIVHWSKREQDIEVKWEAGSKETAGYILDYCFPKPKQDALTTEVKT